MLIRVFTHKPCLLLKMLVFLDFSFKWYVLASLLCLAVSVPATHPSACYSWDVFQDGRLDGRTLRSLKTGPFTCLRECLLRKSCQSINYCYPTQDCHLNYEITSPNNSLRKDIFPFKYLEKTNMNHLLDVSPCSDSVCGDGERCAVLYDQSVMCGTTECQPVPPERYVLVKATPKSSPMAVGSQVVYKCSANESVRIERYCQQSGRWRDHPKTPEPCVTQNG